MNFELFKLTLQKRCAQFPERSRGKKFIQPNFELDLFGIKTLRNAVANSMVTEQRKSVLEKIRKA